MKPKYVYYTHNHNCVIKTISTNKKTKFTINISGFVPKKDTMHDVQLHNLKLFNNSQYLKLYYFRSSQSSQVLFADT